MLNRDCEEEEEDLPDRLPWAREAITELEAALTQLRGILKELGEDVD